jgi:glycosyltransferase involved in cell wall biosynthesis
MPAGIDTALFTPQPVPRKRHALYMQGRITPSKHIEGALKALRSVREFIPEATLTLVGPEDEQYGKKLRAEFADVLNAVTFSGSKPNEQTPSLYSAHGVSINLAADGHYDKSVLESMACGTPTLFSSKAFTGLISDQVYIPTPESLVSGLLYIMQLSEDEYQALGAHVRTLVIRNESLDLLITKLVHELSS